MRVFVLYAHPEPTSFCGALKDVAVATILEAGHEALVSDLYADGFNPVAGRHDFTRAADPARFHYQTEQLHAARSGGFADDIAGEQEKFAAADLVVAIFPIWWSGAPAIVKGWMERVLAYGFAYVDGARFESGLFPNKRGMLAVTTGGTRERFSAEGVYGPIEGVLAPIQKSVFGYLGMPVLPPFVAYAAPRVDDAARAAYLTAWKARLIEAIAIQAASPSNSAQGVNRLPDGDRGTSWSTRA